MGRVRIIGVLVGALALTGSLTQAGASAEDGSGPYSGWSHREDARAPDAGSIETAPGSGLHLYSFNNQVSITSDAPTGGTSFGGIEFLPPAGQTLTTGVTYTVGGALRQPTSAAGQVIAHRDGKMCGRLDEDLTDIGWMPTPPTAGWFHVDHIERIDGRVVSFAATYEVSCQYLDGPLGFEGSIAYNAPLPPAPVPAAPSTPDPVTDLEAVNTDPNGGGTNTTTLTWTNPATYGDITIAMVQSTDPSLLPSLVADHETQQWRGRGNRYLDEHVEFMENRTYRVVARGESGRVSAPALITVKGSRLDVPVTNRTIMIGQRVSFSGRLTQSLSVGHPDGADPMSGPALAGRTVILCRQSSTKYVDGACSKADSTTTSVDGRFTLSATPVANSYYSVMLPSSPDLVGNRSHVLTTGVAPHTDLRAPASEAAPASAAAGAVASAATARTAAFTSTSTLTSSTVTTTAGVRRGAIIHFTTSRARRGSLGVARLQHYSAGRWRTVRSKTLVAGTDRLRIPFREYTRGLHSFRVLKPADSRHVNGRSQVLRVRVR